MGIYIKLGVGLLVAAFPLSLLGAWAVRNGHDTAWWSFPVLIWGYFGAMACIAGSTACLFMVIDINNKESE